VEYTLSSTDKMKLEQSGTPPSAAAEDSQTSWILNATDGGGELQTFSTLGVTLVNSTVWIGKLFLALIKMVVIPLVVCSLVVGVASLGDFRKLGRIGGRTIGIFTMTTVAALTIGITLANLIRPGRLVSDKDKANLLASFSGKSETYIENAVESPSLGEQIVGIVPTNPVASMVDGNMLQIIFFAMMLGIALTLIEAVKSQPVVDVLDGVNQAMVMIVHIVMKLAPIGVATLLFEVVGTTGISVLMALMVYAFVVMGGLVLHAMVTYQAVVRLGAKLPFFEFLGAMKEALLVGFSTSSSSATLPVTMECVESNIGVSKSMSSFVLPLGATVNMDGTALYQGVAAIFIAQVMGIDLTMADQITIVGTATLASIGAAGVPGAGMVTLAMVLTAIGVPAAGIALVIGVDRILDMFRTATNIIGDTAVTACMARIEGEQLRIMSDAEDASNPNKGFEGRIQEQQAVTADDA
ncbi:MAG: dicarboxylate/amino acid:cation symporter, partial [Myxococcota bacterium]|nr:dicarboxylate/amino acid:cation symporter [Myxococcota bacterium]